MAGMGWLAPALLCAALLARACAGDQFLTFQNGHMLTPAGGGAQQYYNETYDTSITEQYIEAWNHFNGGWGWASRMHACMGWGRDDVCLTRPDTHA